MQVGKAPSALSTSVWSWGSGLLGAAGHGSYAATQIPQRVATLPAGAVRSIAVGWASSLAITTDGRLLQWGWPQDFHSMSRCLLTARQAPGLVRFLQRRGWGVAGFTPATTTPTLVDIGDERFSCADAGSSWVVAVTKDGQAYSYGDGRYGQLGLGAAIDYQRDPVQIESIAKHRILQVSCGMSHTLLLDDQGIVYSCGKFDSFALGVGCEKNHIGSLLRAGRTPMSIQASTRFAKTAQLGSVVKVSAGANTTAMLDTDGQIWTCGKNGSAQLGLGDFRHRPVPTRLEAFDGERIIDMAAGHHHMIALTESNRVFTWGVGNHGQCGRPLRRAVVNNDLVANRAGGIGTRLYSFHPGTVDFPLLDGKAARVFAGPKQSAIVTDQGHCLVVGVSAFPNYDGELNADDEETPQYEARVLMDANEGFVSSIHFGIEHAIALRHQFVM